jgi:hypothetical protein
MFYLLQFIIHHSGMAIRFGTPILQSKASSALLARWRNQELWLPPHSSVWFTGVTGPMLSLPPPMSSPQCSRFHSCHLLPLTWSVPCLIFSSLILFHLSLSSSASTRQIGRGETGGQQAWPWASSPTGGPAVGAPEQASSPARGPTPWAPARESSSAGGPAARPAAQLSSPVQQPAARSNVPRRAP